MKQFLQWPFLAASALVMSLGAQISETQQRHMPDVLYVKFKDDSGIRVAGQLLKTPAGTVVFTDIAIAQAGTWRSVHALEPAKLQALRATAAGNLGKAIYDPSSEFFFRLHNATQLSTLKKKLSLNPKVERVEYVPVLSNALPPDYFSTQHYKNNVSSGINAEAIWTTYNNRGTGIRMCDIEYAFNTTHTDLNPVTVLGPTPQDPFNGAGIDHGTAVLGEIGSKNNGWGTTGLASDCQLFFAGAYTNNVYDLAGAITTALASLNPGDVILLEQQIDGPNFNGSGQDGLVPVEWFEAYYDAIELATGQGVIVVEAAGNGGENLDDAIYSTGTHQPFNGTKHSGAIIVGASSADPTFGGSSTARSRLWYSNYGSRVDVQGIGEQIVTTGYGDLFSTDGADAYYTADFGGTSGASPIVTSAVVLLQSVYKASTGGSVLNAGQISSIFKATGKSQQTGTFPVSEHIGPMPDLLAATQMALATVGIQSPQAQNQELLIMPNPGNGLFWVKGAALEQAHNGITVLNTLGQQVASYAPSRHGESIQIDLSGFPAGIYYLHVDGDTVHEVRKVIVSE